MRQDRRRCYNHRTLNAFRRIICTCAPGLLLAVAAPACGGGDDDQTDTPAVTSSPTDAPTVDVAGVPELADGVLSFGLHFAFPPMAFYEDGTQTPAGFEVDLATALAEHLGVTAEFHQVANVEAIVGDAKAQLYEGVMASIPITTEREAEVDFVRYLGPVGMGILVQFGNPPNITRWSDQCGNTIAILDIPNHHFYLQETNADFCAADPIVERVFPDYASGAEAVRQGEVDAQLAEDPAVAYAVAHSNGELAHAIVGFDSNNYGLGVSKQSPQLTAALQQAFDAIRDDGTYAQILADWSLDHFAYTR